MITQQAIESWHLPHFLDIQALSEETLSELCDDFRRRIFSKAGKDDPARAASNTFTTQRLHASTTPPLVTRAPDTL